MSESLVTASRTVPGPWPGWCCSYCAAPLEAGAHGLTCAREGRWFATDRGVHRLLAQERRRELQAPVEAARRARRDEARRVDSARLEEALGLAGERLGPGPWRVLDVGAGSGWASARMLALGHSVAAVDVDLNESDGLLAAGRLLDDPSCLPRAEADMEALPVEPASMDLVLAAGVLHHATDLARALVELRRVTRRQGLLVVLGSPVHRSAALGEQMIADRAAGDRDRYGFSAGFGVGYLVRGELAPLFGRCGWRLEVHGRRPRIAEIGHALADVTRRRARRPRFPILVARRDG